MMGADDLHEIDRIRRATPTVDRIAEECGATVRSEVNAFGREVPVATVPAALAFEAMRDAHRLDTVRQSQLEAKRPKETLRDSHGHTRKVWNIHAEQVAKERGLKPVWTKFRRHGPTLTRYWLSCGHFIEREIVPGGSCECPWGCGEVSVEIPDHDPSQNRPSVVIH
jgi:predicted NAD-dependent protein-ADP-ribosyltransferase YbiA (DUF1768 family)